MRNRESFEFLRLRFSITALINIAFIMFMVICVFNFFLFDSNSIKAKRFVDLVIENNGKLETLPENYFIEMTNKPSMPVEDGFSKKKRGFQWMNYDNLGLFTDGFKNYCSVLIDPYGASYEFIRNFAILPADYTQEYLVYKAVVFKNENKDRTENFHGYTFTFANVENGTLLVILDRKNDFQQQANFGYASIVIFCLSLLIAYGLSWGISVSAMRPIYDAVQKQRQFIADASHELKTPIAVIGANVDVLQQEYPDNKWISYIKTENNRMSGLIRDMLYLAKNDAGRTEYSMLPFDLCESVSCAVLPFESVAFEEGKTFEINIPDTVIPVTADETKIKQLVIILVDNAFKNSDKGAFIRVTVGREDSSRCFVSVYNTGRGIAPNEIKKIFNRFYRTDFSRARTTGGYGLGLAIAKNIATDHKGKISVESVVNDYTQFTFSFPGSFKVGKGLFSKK